MFPQDTPHLDEDMDVGRLWWPASLIQPTAFQRFGIRRLETVHGEH
jgi:hypothetical protein